MENFISVRYYFYQVKQKKVRLLDVLNNILEMPINERELDINGTIRFLSDRTCNSPLGKSFLFETKRTRGIPQKIKSNGTRESLELESDEGLAEETVLACDSTSSIVSIQYNKYSIHPGTISKYLKKYPLYTIYNFYQ